MFKRDGIGILCVLLGAALMSATLAGNIACAGTRSSSFVEARDRHLAHLQRRLFGAALQHARPDQCRECRIADAGVGFSTRATAI